MKGAESILRTLVNAGVDTCFTNPGTSEMQFVAAVDRVAGMRCILGLFEGVVSGAADGYGRMLGKPATTLLHLGPGLANGLANFHNANKARTPIVNIVGEHASYHRDLNPPLAADIEAFAKPVSNWIATVTSADEIATRTFDAVIAARQPPGQIATLIIPADYSWLDGEDPINQSLPEPVYTPIDDENISQIARALTSGKSCALLMRGRALQDTNLMLAGKIASSSGAKLFSDTFSARKQRGADRTPVQGLPYFSSQAIQALSGIEHLILVESSPPVGFFAYPNEANELTPEGAKTWQLSAPGQDTRLALSKLVEALDASNEKPLMQSVDRPAAGSDALNPDTIAQSLGAFMPENAIIIDEAISSGISLLDYTRGAPPHDWLDVTGGSIGQGLPLATGTAVACPEQRTICMQADGSGMYTLQALWTHARESLNITTVIYANRSYQILNIEHERVGAGAPGTKADSMMSLTNPELDWVRLARGMGVTAERVTEIDDFNRLFQGFLHEDGPNLIEAVF